MQGGAKAFTDLRTFIGVVEDRNDPNQLGRVKVRIYSVHNEDKSQIPTKDLPWAMVLQTGSNAATSGVGYSGTGIVEGTWVFGLFLDEGEFQNPLVLGSLHGKPDLGPAKDQGFNDPRGVYPKNDGDTYTLGESSISRLARGRKHAEKHAVLISKREGKDKLGEVDIAKGPSVGSVIEKAVKAVFDRRDDWTEPHPRTGEGRLKKWWEGTNNYSTYPFCHVWYTESGHALEVDDTPGAERLHWYHRSGSFQEIQATGDQIEKVIGDSYEIDLKNKHMYIGGDFTITVDGDSKELVHGNKIVEVDGEYLVTVRKDYTKKVEGNELKEIGSDKSSQINGNHSERVSLGFIKTVVGNATESIKGSFTKTTKGQEKRTNLSDMTQILPDNYQLIGANNLTIAAGGNLTVKADGQLNLRSEANTVLSAGTGMVVKANTGLMDIDAPQITMDAPNLSIDGPDGNITSKTVTLHSHTHNTSDPSHAQHGTDTESDPPTGGT